MKSKYVKIYDDILNKIENNIYKVGDCLPSEADLMKEYEVSRDTIRKSLNMLVTNGYITKARGKLATVSDIHKLNFPIAKITSFSELSQQEHMESETILEEFQVVKNNKYIMDKLNLTEEQEVWNILRTRRIDGERVILDQDYIRRDIVDGLTEQICTDSIYKYIEQKLNIQIGYARKEITVQKVSELDRKYLDIKDDEMIVVVKSYTYLSDGRLFQYTISKHRADRFKFVEFAVRTNPKLLPVELMLNKQL
ncbi:trehalose operon repressor [Turicibacter bilis]|uniref:Trehalose operon repressor n=1 Tax=Turicibacter bilis TaxID=2735723 RepID=A0A9Q9CSQ1_9FIRM|nr:trehalose operon repressor [Turicibacter bilis]MBS3197258.1 trehalose operon repressor [Turicibacter bilis]UUF09128.1 trehalose operon repressor [Turicibacter bilis]